MVRIKNTKLKESSRKWVARQLKDPYVQKAQKENYRARSAYKLQEIHEKYNILKPNQHVIDLGCAPGSWLQMAHHIVQGNIYLYGVDILPLEPLPYGNILQGDISDDALYERLLTLVAHNPIDGVMSDMAADTTGHKKTDHLRTLYLAEIALDVARQTLTQGGFFLCKVFQGGANGAFYNDIKQAFQMTRHVKPKASRKESPELYLLATGFKG